MKKTRKQTRDLLHLMWKGEQLMDELGISNYAFAGSVTLLYRGIDLGREAHDLDIICPSEYYKAVSQLAIKDDLYGVCYPEGNYYRITFKSYGTDIDVMFIPEFTSNVESLSSKQFATLDNIIATKKQFNRDKDRQDIAKILNWKEFEKPFEEVQELLSMRKRQEEEICWEQISLESQVLSAQYRRAERKDDYSGALEDQDKPNWAKRWLRNYFRAKKVVSDKEAFAPFFGVSSRVWRGMEKCESYGGDLRDLVTLRDIHRKGSLHWHVANDYITTYVRSMLK